jgi:hypothetical protein
MHDFMFDCHLPRTTLTTDAAFQKMKCVSWESFRRYD